MVKAQKKAIQTSLLPENEVEFEPKVVKSNLLIQSAKSELTAVEMRVLVYTISKIQYNDDELKPCTLSIPEFCRLVGLDSRSQYTKLREMTKKLKGRTVEIFEDENTLLQTSWIRTVRYNIGKGTITVQLEDALKNELLQLRKNFTSYGLHYILLLDGRYAMQVYELLKSYEGMGHWNTKLDNLKKLLVANGYDNFADFKRFILEPALRQINDKTDISVDYELERERKKVVGIEFKISKNKSNAEAVVPFRYARLEEIRAIIARLVLDRQGTAKERKYVDAWLDAGYREDMIIIAADRCSITTGKLSFAYIDKVIKNWEENGIITPTQAEDELQQRITGT